MRKLNLMCAPLFTPVENFESMRDWVVLRSSSTIGMER